MASRKFKKRLGNALAILGTAYAASKVLESGKTPDLKPKLKPSLKSNIQSSLLDKTGAGTDYSDSLMNLSNLDKTGTGTTYSDNKPGMFEGVKKFFKPSLDAGRDDAMSAFGPMAKEGKFIKASKGTMVVAKTKLGKTKPTKLY
jgi:hypothetical protein